MQSNIVMVYRNLKPPSLQSYSGFRYYQRHLFSIELNFQHARSRIWCDRTGGGFRLRTNTLRMEVPLQYDRIFGSQIDTSRDQGKLIDVLAIIVDLSQRVQPNHSRPSHCKQDSFKRERRTMPINELGREFTSAQDNVKKNPYFRHDRTFSLLERCTHKIVSRIRLCFAVLTRR